ncbi:hypothetical protein Q9L58_010596 [Maublancomyces gigas]|uniref:Uncharacterized protein n=1 Tax=Discina gigas TaxID=1032678 RepID=A0ABR3G3M3_9PEZI
MAADKFLRQVQTNAASTAVKPLQASKKRKVAAEHKLERSDQLRNIYREESHFNFIKIHLLAHFTGHVKRFGNIPSYSTEVGEVCHREQIKVGYRASNRIHYTKQILEHYARRQTVALLVMAIRMAAHGKLPGDLGELLTDMVNKESLLTWMQESEVWSERRPRRVLRGPVSSKTTRFLSDVMLDIGDRCLPQKIADYSKRSLRDAQRLTTNIAELKQLRAERFKQLEIAVSKFQETDYYTIHRGRCTVDKGFRGGIPRNDWVSVSVGDESQYGALRGRLPCQLR